MRSLHITQYQLSFVAFPFREVRCAYACAYTYMYADYLVMFCRDKSDEDYVFGFFDQAAVATGSSFDKSKT